VDVVNLAEAGSMLVHATSQVERVTAIRALVLLEIGGNDLFAKTPPPEFERGLEVLLQRAQAPGRQLVMLELPLPPFANEYGVVQRRLARKHGAILIPKRFFARVLAGDGNTTDGLHLSAKGHRKMAETIWRLLGNSLQARPRSFGFPGPPTSAW